MEIQKDVLVKEGLQLLDEALHRFNVIKDCEHSSFMSGVLYHLIKLASALYGLNK